MHEPGEHGYGTVLVVVRQRRLRHGDRATEADETVYDGWEIAPEAPTETDGTVRDITTTRLQAYGGPERRPDIRPDDRVHLAVDRRRDRHGRALQPSWQVVGEPSYWGPGETVVSLQRVTG
ncbi:hypothetical protein GCM10009613_61200 [Pseudonocardia kongjuensis]|uniref:Head-to-tail stopper n=1 Tax=Pseudonocardia kongjuensis TaxID=102227 RepID=A0ABN1YA30_9PSEU